MTTDLYGRASFFIRHKLYCLILSAVCLHLLLFSAVLSSAVIPSNALGISDLTKLISENEDIHITANDLAYFLVIHDFDARPAGNHVELSLNGTIYELVPNGPYIGLANITIKSR